MAKRKSKEVRASNVFHCVKCAKDVDAKDIKEHLRQVHHLKEFKGRRETTMHIDGDTWFSWEYNWTIGRIKLIQTAIYPREKDDPMRFC